LYRKKLAELIPSLTQIDATMIGGLAMHGIPAPNLNRGPVETDEQRLRRMQEMVIEKAKAEREQKKT